MQFRASQINRGSDMFPFTFDQSSFVGDIRDLNVNSHVFNTQAQATLATRNGDPAAAVEVPSLAYRPVAQRLSVDVAVAALVAAVAVAAAAAAVYTAEGLD